MEFVDNLPEDKMGEERLLAINFRTGEFIVDNIEEYNKILACPDSVVLIHNHSGCDIPSGQDLLTYLHDEKIKLSIIACHNGDLYAIYGVRSIFEEVYNKFLEIEKTKTTDIREAKKRTTTKIYALNETLSDRHKYFIVKKL